MYVLPYSVLIFFKIQLKPNLQHWKTQLENVLQVDCLLVSGVLREQWSYGEIRKKALVSASYLAKWILCMAEYSSKMSWQTVLRDGMERLKEEIEY